VEDTLHRDTGGQGLDVGLGVGDAPRVARRLLQLVQRHVDDFAVLMDGLDLLGHGLPYRDLWEWYGRWSSGEMPSWQSRRNLVNGLSVISSRGSHMAELQAGSHPSPLVGRELTGRSRNCASGLHLPKPKNNFKLLDCSAARL
jgi:hypothetical protein